MSGADGAGGFYPIVLCLGGRRALVVGGGKVAARKASGLLDAGARVVAVSPKFSPAFIRLVPSGAVTCIERPYQANDLADASLVIAATDDPKVNAQVRADARHIGVWVSVVDDPENSDFIVPAVVRRGDFLLAMSSGGASPGLVGHLRRELDLLVPDDIGFLVALLAKARGRIQRAVTDPDRRRELMSHLLTLDLLSTLRTEGAGAVIRQIDDLIAPRDQRRGLHAGTPSAGETPDRRGPDGHR
ncbi:MAG: bifunctional precorrin-2 dehydrogenase/sirohydrochlorin ferrochelatase [candidate division NC10 bacterium]|nr:bifunctional precorrin-2 dehydrogenase/sirohydrochlorin ferrochelatase [Candidatus Rokubacteria bacterium]MBI2563058.1 bifunctional precorrin-2 dehydrogenase/sirohydrochlorin ferrochelatase [candidate division NC10 bacterium]